MDDRHSTLDSHPLIPCAPVMGLQMAYPNPNPTFQTWLPEQPLASFSISNVIHPLVENPLPSSDPPQITNRPNSRLKSNALKRKPKLDKSVRCEICDIFCSDLNLYEQHLSGKKHLKTLKKNYPPQTTPSESTPQTVVNSSAPENLLTICDVPRDSHKPLEDHVAGHKDGDQVCLKEISITGDGMEESSSITTPTAAMDDRHSTLDSHPLIPCAPVKGLQMAYPNPNQTFQTWLPQQPLASFSISNVIHPLVENPLPSSNPPQITNRPNSRLKSNALKRKPKLDKSVRCEICDIFCSNLKLYEQHLSGKKHLKTLKKNYPPQTTPSESTPQSVVNSSAPENILTTCNVPCESEKPFEDHVAGHKDGDQTCLKEISITGEGMEESSSITVVSGHGMAEPSSRSIDEGLDARKRKLMESGIVEESVLLCSTGDAACKSDVTSANDLVGEKHNIQEATTSTVIPSVSAGEDLVTKKQKLIQSGVAEASLRVCTTCNVVCNSEVGFADHIQGKKHIAQVQKSSVVSQFNQLIPLTQKNPPENSDSKRQKVGASSMRVCAMCNVVCNSDLGFNNHLLGSKHASKLRKMAQMVVAPPSAALMPQ